MSQLANPDTPLDAPVPQYEAWTCLLHLETQVQLTQASLTHHMTKLSTLCQTTDHISQFLQALLERLLPCTAPPPVAEPSLAAPAVSAAAPGVLAGPWVQLPLALSDTYNGDHTSGEHFLQSCLTYIHLSGDAFDSDVLKIAWMLSYMKARRASTYILHILWRPRGVESFTDWAAFERNLQAEFFPIDPAKFAALALRNREQYGQGKAGEALGVASAGADVVAAVGEVSGTAGAGTDVAITGSVIAGASTNVAVMDGDGWEDAKGGSG
ncbi:hypothetical protein C0993_008245 [Termitomyces sp. T159_Od127]|nr:hypothetical protein C0993_008245 [Termitomyces sp. T159_Od127]